MTEVVSFINDKEKQEQLNADKAADNARADRRIEYQEARADARAVKENPQKKSTYFETVDSQVKYIIDDLKNKTYKNPLPKDKWKYIEDEKGNKIVDPKSKYSEEKLSDRVKKVNTAEYQKIIDTVTVAVQNNLINRDEAELIFNKYSIPYK